MCRPGRLDKLLYVDLPNPNERVEIFRTASRKLPMASGAQEMGERVVREKCDGFSGADLAALVRESGVVALRTRLGALDGGVDISESGEDILVTGENIASALQKVSPSVSVAQRRKYESLRSKFAGLPMRGGRRRHDAAEGASGDGDGDLSLA
jgi:ribosome biogenesis ATPase